MITVISKLKLFIFFLSPTHKYANSAFSSWTLFFPLPQPFFRIFFPIKPT